MSDFVAVGLGAILGANARYWVSTLVADWLGVGFPYGTFLVNAAGSFLLGLAYSALARDAGLTGAAQLAATTGLLGAFTTFSTFSYETVALARQGAPGLALVNALGSVAVGLAAGGGGLALGHFLAEVAR